MRQAFCSYYGRLGLTRDMVKGTLADDLIDMKFKLLIDQKIENMKMRQDRAVLELRQSFQNDIQECKRAMRDAINDVIESRNDLHGKLPKPKKPKRC